MVYKPVGVDENSKFPPRVMTALSALFAAKVKRIPAKPSGVAALWGLPNTNFMGVSSAALTVGQVRYTPIDIRTAVTLSALQYEVTTGPTAAANIRIGIYAADTTHQPVGAALYDSGNQLMAANFTGVKTITGLTTVLQPGAYLIAVISDTAMTLRAIASSSPSLQGMGATPVLTSYLASMSYGVFPTTPIPWTTYSTNTQGMAHAVLAQWTE